MTMLVFFRGASIIETTRDTRANHQESGRSWGGLRDFVKIILLHVLDYVFADAFKNHETSPLLQNGDSPRQLARSKIPLFQLYTPGSLGDYQMSKRYVTQPS